MQSPLNEVAVDVADESSTPHSTSIVANNRGFSTIAGGKTVEAISAFDLVRRLSHFHAPLAAARRRSVTVTETVVDAESTDEEEDEKLLISSPRQHRDPSSPTFEEREDSPQSQAISVSPPPARERRRSSVATPFTPALFDPSGIRPVAQNQQQDALQAIRPSREHSSSSSYFSVQPESEKAVLRSQQSNGLMRTNVDDLDDGDDDVDGGGSERRSQRTSRAASIATASANAPQSHDSFVAFTGGASSRRQSSVRRSMGTSTASVGGQGNPNTAADIDDISRIFGDVSYHRQSMFFVEPTDALEEVETMRRGDATGADSGGDSMNPISSGETTPPAAVEERFDAQAVEELGRAANQLAFDEWLDLGQQTTIADRLDMAAKKSGLLRLPLFRAFSVGGASEEEVMLLYGSFNGDAGGGTRRRGAQRVDRQMLGTGFGENANRTIYEGVYDPSSVLPSLIEGFWNQLDDWTYAEALDLESNSAVMQHKHATETAKVVPKIQIDAVERTTESRDRSPNQRTGSSMATGSISDARRSIHTQSILQLEEFFKPFQQRRRDTEISSRSGGIGSISMESRRSMDKPVAVHNPRSAPATGAGRPPIAHSFEVNSSPRSTPSPHAAVQFPHADAMELSLQTDDAISRNVTPSTMSRPPLPTFAAGAVSSGPCNNNQSYDAENSTSQARGEAAEPSSGDGDGGSESKGGDAGSVNGAFSVIAAHRITDYEIDIRFALRQTLENLSSYFKPPKTFEDFVASCEAALVVLSDGDPNGETRFPLMADEEPPLAGAEALLSYVASDLIDKAHEMSSSTYCADWVFRYTIAFANTRVAVDEADAILREDLVASCIECISLIHTLTTSILALGSKIRQYQEFDQLRAWVESQADRLIGPLERRFHALMTKCPFPEQRNVLKKHHKVLESMVATAVNFLSAFELQWSSTVPHHNAWKEDFLNRSYQRLHGRVASAWMTATLGFIDPVLHLLVKADKRVTGNDPMGFRKRITMAAHVEKLVSLEHMSFYQLALTVKGVASAVVGLQLCMGARFLLEEMDDAQDAKWGFSMCHVVDLVGATSHHTTSAL